MIINLIIFKTHRKGDDGAGKKPLEECKIPIEENAFPQAEKQNPFAENRNPVAEKQNPPVENIITRLHKKNDQGVLPFLQLVIKITLEENGNAVEEFLEAPEERENQGGEKGKLNRSQTPHKAMKTRV